MVNYLTIVSSVFVFSSIIFVLVNLLIIASEKLLPQDDVIIDINDGGEKLKIKPGSNLLSALSNMNIFLPSACGGGGTCAMCKCQISSGGGDILTTELSSITRSEAKDDWRLSCQVKVKNDMKIKIPEEIFNIKKWESTVRSNQNVATFIKELVLDLPKGELLNFKSGGYIQIYIPEYKISYSDFNIQK